MANSATAISRLGSLSIAGIFLALATPAGAVTTYAKFYYGGNGYGGPYNGAGTVYDATKGGSVTCPASGGCGPADNVSTPMVFSGVGITATAGGAAGNKPWADFSPNFGGLGVGTGSPSDSDQIAGSDVLILTFASQVKLTGVGTLFDPGHTPFGANFPTAASVDAVKNSIVFSLSVDTIDGGAFHDYSFSAANSLALSLVGTTFEFMQKAGNPEYYVSALGFETCGPAGAGCAPGGQTPIPSALPLFSTGLGLVGLLGWRRKRKSAAAI
jgi:hypothetical protein